MTTPENEAMNEIINEEEVIDSSYEIFKLFIILISIQFT
jgi:hypothetical protein